MSILSRAYASYMTHFHKYQPRLDVLHEAFSQTYDLIYNGQFIECDLSEKIDEYPKYPTIYRFFKKTANFNMLKIYNVAPDTVEYITDYITNKNALNLRPRLNTIPNDLIKLRNDIYFQYTFWAEVNDLFNTKLHFHDYSMMRKIVNYYNSLDEDPYNEEFMEDSSSFVHIFLFDFLFRQQLKNMTNFPTALNMYCINNDIFNKTQIKQEFNSFMDNNKIEFFSLSSKIILQSLYRMAKIDKSVTDYISKSIINKNLERLKKNFGLYIDDYISHPVGELTQYALNSFYLVYGSNQISDLHKNSDIFNLGFIQSNALNEDVLFRNYIENTSTTNLKSYLYLSYLYKFWPIKFLNVNPIIMGEYVQEIVKPESSLAFTHRTLESVLSFSLSSANLNYSKLRDYLETNITPDYLVNLANNENVIKFTFFIYFTKLFDNFMKHQLYNDFVQELYKDIFVILRDRGHIDNLFNWNECQILFDLFFKSIIRLKVSNNEIFTASRLEYEQAFNSILESSTGDSIYDLQINFQENRIKSLYSNLVSSHFDKIHYFIESIYLSSISSTVGHQMLAYFLK